MQYSATKNESVKINPLFRLFWDAINLVAILLSAITVPFELIYGFNQFETIYWITTWIFLIDIFVQFNTYLRMVPVLLSERQRNGFYYLRTWFAIDLLSALPFLFIFHLFGVESLALLTVAHSLRLLRVFRLIEMNIRIRQVVLQINPALFRLILFFMWFVIVVHFLALGWVYVGGIQGNWEDLHRHLLAVYWTLTTIVGVGYGDITPDKGSYVQILYAIGVELVGVCVFGYIIGNIASLVSNLDLNRANYRKKLEEVDTFFRERRVPRDLHEKVRNYYAYLWKTRRNAESVNIINELPHTLQIEISLFLNRDVIRKVSLFTDTSESFIHEIVMMLEPMVYLPGDIIIREGEHADCMYFIASGDVEVTVKSEILAVLSTGSPFGESALVGDKLRNATVRSLGYTDVYKLSKKNFDALRQKYPDFDEHVKEIIKKREEHTASKISHH